MAAWENQIMQKLKELNECCVRFDVDQTLNNTQKGTAQTNIGFTGASVEVISDSDYKVIV